MMWLMICRRGGSGQARLHQQEQSKQTAGRTAAAQPSAGALPHPPVALAAAAGTHLAFHILGDVLQPGGGGRERCGDRERADGRQNLRALLPPRSWAPPLRPPLVHEG